jgi:dGTPase
MVVSLFRYYISNIDEVPEEFRSPGGESYRVVADYISSMTDRYAIRLYQELFVPRAWGLS